MTVTRDEKKKMEKGEKQMEKEAGKKYVSIRQHTSFSILQEALFILFWGMKKDEKKVKKEAGKRQKRRRKEDEKKMKEKEEERAASLSMCACCVC